MNYHKIISDVFSAYFRLNSFIYNNIVFNTMNSQDTRYFVRSYTSLQRNLFLMLFYLDVSIRVVFKFVERLFQVFNVYVFFFF